MEPKHPNNVPTAAQQAAFEAAMQEEHQMVFTKAELIVIFNVLTKINATYGDFKAIDPIVQKIQPVVAVDSNIPSHEDALPLIGAPKRNES